MRGRLERFLGKRIVVRARFRFFGTKTLPDGHIVRYMLIEDIRDEQNRMLTPHMWMQLRPGEAITVPMKQYDIIQFSALVKQYAKGNKRKPKHDYGLIRPRDVQVIKQEEAMKEHKGWQVIQGLRAPQQKDIPWPRLCQIEYDLTHMPVRGNNIQARIMRSEKQTLFAVRFDNGSVATSDGYTFETLTDLKNLLSTRGKYKIIWQDGEIEKSEGYDDER